MILFPLIIIINYNKNNDKHSSSYVSGYFTLRILLKQRQIIIFFVIFELLIAE